MVFAYGEDAVSHLKKRDKQLGEVIDKLGMLRREMNPDLFGAVVHAILGQQISGAAQRTVWERLEARVGTVNARALCELGAQELQALGTSHRKAAYILEFAGAVEDGRLDLETLPGMGDAQVVEALTAIRGIGAWTAEMLLLFSMGRPDVLSFGDLAIHRGMRMLYRHREVSRERFERYRRRYSPYGSVASLYLWAVAGGAVEGLEDPAARAKNKKA